MELLIILIVTTCIHAVEVSNQLGCPDSFVYVNGDDFYLRPGDSREILNLQKELLRYKRKWMSEYKEICELHKKASEIYEESRRERDNFYSDMLSWGISIAMVLVALFLFAAAEKNSKRH